MEKLFVSGQVLNNLKFTKKVIALFLGICFSLVIVELSLRILGYVQGFKQATVVTDKSSVVGESKYKILAVGNSYTAGIGASDGMSYPEQLNTKLKNYRADYYEVINKGEGAVNSSYIKEKIPGWLETHKPKIVFIMTGEPNNWNKYGYWSFLNQKKKLNTLSLDSFIEKIRLLKIFKLYSLLMNRPETWNKSAGVKYSNTFTSIPLDEKHKKILAYSWLGALEIGGQFRGMPLLKPNQIDEALECLIFLNKIEKNPVATRLVAEILIMKKNQVSLGLKFLNEAIESTSDFNYGQYKILQSIDDSKLNKNESKTLAEIKEKILTRPLPLKLDFITKWHESEPDQNLLNGVDRISYLEALHQTYPSSIQTTRILLESLPHDSQGKLLDYIEKTVLLNPLSQVNTLLNRTELTTPSLKPKFEKLLTKLEDKFEGLDFKNMVFEQNLEEEWIISDLESIIKTVQDSGAFPIVQTYPPLKNGENRFADLVLRNWWKNRSSKTNLAFMDVEVRMKKLFNGPEGNKYYTKKYGPNDNHQNDLGYEEIAKIMLPYVLSTDKNL